MGLLAYCLYGFGLIYHAILGWIDKLLSIGKKEIKIVLVGLKGVGKTTILYRLKLGETIITIPTTDVNVENLEFKELFLQIWDIGSVTAPKPQYFREASALVYVLDSSCPENLPKAKKELHKILSKPDLKDTPILVFANKQDVPNALGVDEIKQTLELESILSHSWHVQPCCAIRGQGLQEGIDWMLKKLKIKSK